ncbi:cyclase family protein [Nocardioides sp. GXQ0305]|uniref:cyclase family protein n=1 Tax=Nocardioides sp. GXQ0305 TaxID=3423912 RepID=UPI003D7E99F4
MQLVDLNHVIEHGMTTYPGLPGPEVGDHLSFDASHDVYTAGTEFTIGRLSMVGNTGTYLDTPYHRFRDGWDVSALRLEQCVDLPAVVVDGDGAIGADAFAGLDVAGAAVLLRTGWDQHWRSERYGDPEHPFLDEDGARHLVEAGAVLVGIDSVNIDDTRGRERPAHTTLLGADVVVVEHLTGLDALPASGARFTAVPIRVAGLGTLPVRAFARLHQ